MRIAFGPSTTGAAPRQRRRAGRSLCGEVLPLGDVAGAVRDRPVHLGLRGRSRRCRRRRTARRWRRSPRVRPRLGQVGRAAGDAEPGELSSRPRPGRRTRRAGPSSSGRRPRSRRRPTCSRRRSPRCASVTSWNSSACGPRPELAAPVERRLPDRLDRRRPVGRAADEEQAVGRRDERRRRRRLGQVEVELGVLGGLPLAELAGLAARASGRRPSSSACRRADPPATKMLPPENATRRVGARPRAAFGPVGPLVEVARARRRRRRTSCRSPPSRRCRR